MCFFLSRGLQKSSGATQAFSIGGLAIHSNCLFFHMCSLFFYSPSLGGMSCLTSFRTMLMNHFFPTQLTHCSPLTHLLL